jgi:hypothetical protein
MIEPLSSVRPSHPSGYTGQRASIWAELHMALRERMGQEASTSAAVLDSQSVKSAEKGP